MFCGETVKETEEDSGGRLWLRHMYNCNNGDFKSKYFLRHCTEGVNCERLYTHGVAVDTYTTLYVDQPMIVIISMVHIVDFLEVSRVQKGFKPSSLVLCLFLIYYNGCDDLIGRNLLLYPSNIHATIKCQKHSEIS